MRSSAIAKKKLYGTGAIAWRKGQQYIMENCGDEVEWGRIGVALMKAVKTMIRLLCFRAS
jgi:hypothetical protein